MANHKSAAKRAKQSEVRRLRNKAVKTNVKNAVKKVASSTGEPDQALNNLNTAKSVIDRAAKKGVIHKRTAARKISRLSRALNNASA